MSIERSTPVETRGLNGPFFIDGAYSPHPYRDYTFELESARLGEDRGAIKNTPQQRLRYCLHVLTQAYGNAFPEIVEASKPETRDARLKAIAKYLERPVLLNEVEFTRWRIINTAEAEKQAAQHFIVDNRPVGQLISQTEQHTTPGIFRELRASILSVVDPKILVQAYDWQVDIAQQMPAVKNTHTTPTEAV